MLSWEPSLAYNFTHHHSFLLLYPRICFACWVTWFMNFYPIGLFRNTNETNKCFQHLKQSCNQKWKRFTDQLLGKLPLRSTRLTVTLLRWSYLVNTPGFQRNCSANTCLKHKVPQLGQERFPEFTIWTYLPIWKQHHLLSSLFKDCFKEWTSLLLSQMM